MKYIYIYNVALLNPFNRDTLSVFRRFGVGNLILLLLILILTSLPLYIFSLSLLIININ